MSDERRYLHLEIRAQDIVTGKESSLEDLGVTQIDLQESKGERSFHFGKRSIRYRLEGDKLTLDGKFPRVLGNDLSLSGNWERVVPPPPKRKR